MNEMFESLESRQFLSGTGRAHHPSAVAAPLAAAHASTRHRVTHSALSLLGNYDTTFTYHGVKVHLTLNVDHQHKGHVAGTLDASNVPVVGSASVDFTGVVNDDNTFALTFTGDVTGTASGNFAPDYKSANVTYDLDAFGMHFAGSRTFTR